MSEGALSPPFDIKEPTSAPRRRSVYDTIKLSNVKEQVSAEYIEKCRIEIETYESILNSTQGILRKLKKDKSKKTIPADVNQLDQKQKNFLKKSSNYLELVEDFHNHLTIEEAVAQKFRNIYSHRDQILK